MDSSQDPSNMDCGGLDVVSQEIWEHILNYVPPDEEFFSALVCREWCVLLRYKRQKRFEYRWKTNITKCLFSIPLLQLCDFDENTAVNCAKYAHFETLKWLYETKGCILNNEICYHAARHGRFDVIEWARAHGCRLTGKECGGAAAGGHLETLQKLRSLKCQWTSDTCANAASIGRLDIIIWAKAAGCFYYLTHVAHVALQHGHIDIYQWAVDNGYESDQYCDLLYLAVLSGRLDVIQFIYAKGHQLRYQICDVAAKKGCLDILQWAQQQGVNMSSFGYVEAAQFGHLHVIQWAHAQNIPWDDRTCERAAQNKHWDVLRWVVEHGCPWSPDVCYYLALAGNFSLLRWAHDNGCPWNVRVCEGIAASGRLDMLIWFQKQNGPMDYYILITQAARYGHIHILQFLYDRFPLFNVRCFSYATKGGHIHVLEWLCETMKKYEWDYNEAYQLAALNDQLPTIKWLYMKGYRWNDSIYEYIKDTEHKHIIRWFADLN